MTNHLIKLEKHLNLQSLERILSKVKIQSCDADTGDSIEIDSTLTEGYVEPFSILALSRGLKQQSLADKGRVSYAMTYKPQNSYLSYMGFYQATGIDMGPEINTMPGSKNHIPITKIDLITLKERAKYFLQKPGELIEEEAKRITKVLIESGAPKTYEETFVYCFTEILRNTAEHSNSDNVWFCAQYWEKQDKVQIAILDEGRGLLSSLQDSPELSNHITNEKNAVQLACAPGVTRNLEEQPIPNDIWQNTGYGLYYCKKIAQKAGSLTLISNGCGAVFRNGKSTSYMLPALLGVAVRLEIEMSRLGDWPRLLDKIGQDIAKDQEEFSYIKGLKKTPSDKSKGKSSP